MGPNETNNDRTSQQLNDLAGQTFLRDWPDLDVFRQRRNSELDQLLSSEIGKCLWPLFFPVD